MKTVKGSLIRPHESHSFPSNDRSFVCPTTIILIDFVVGSWFWTEFSE